MAFEMSDQPPTPDDNPADRPPRAGRGRGTTGRGPAREVAAGLLAGGLTIKDAAAQAGVGERTLRRWLDEDPEFKATVGRLRSEAVGAAMARLSATMTAAADVLKGLLDSGDEGVKY